MKKANITFIIAALFLMIPLMAQSENIHRTGPCKADFEKFCKDIKPGQGRIAKCMKAHESELSPACRDKIEDDKEKAQAFVKACKPDTDKLCRGVKPGNGRLARCLKQNESLLSVPCKTFLQKR